MSQPIQFTEQVRVWHYKKEKTRQVGFLCQQTERLITLEPQLVHCQAGWYQLHFLGYFLLTEMKYDRKRACESLSQVIHSEKILSIRFLVFWKSLLKTHIPYQKKNSEKKQCGSLKLLLSHENEDAVFKYWL